MWVTSAQNVFKSSETSPHLSLLWFIPSYSQCLHLCYFHLWEFYSLAIRRTWHPNTTQSDVEKNIYKHVCVCVCVKLYTGLICTSIFNKHSYIKIQEQELGPKCQCGSEFLGVNGNINPLETCS